MWSWLKSMFVQIVTSKKGIALIGGVLFTLLAPLLAKIGLPVTEDQVIGVVSIIVGFLIGQGIADAGKVAALVKAETEAVPLRLKK